MSAPLVLTLALALVAAEIRAQTRGGVDGVGGPLGPETLPSEYKNVPIDQSTDTAIATDSYEELSPRTVLESTDDLQLWSTYGQYWSTNDEQYSTIEANYYDGHEYPLKDMLRQIKTTSMNTTPTTPKTKLTFADKYSHLDITEESNLWGDAHQVYKVMVQNRSRQVEASAICRFLGYKLATVLNATMVAKLKQIIDYYGFPAIWLAGKRRNMRIQEYHWYDTNNVNWIIKKYPWDMPKYGWRPPWLWADEVFRSNELVEDNLKPCLVMGKISGRHFIWQSECTLPKSDGYSYVCVKGYMKTTTKPYTTTTTKKFRPIRTTKYRGTRYSSRSKTRHTKAPRTKTHWHRPRPPHPRRPTIPWWMYIKKSRGKETAMERWKAGGAKEGSTRILGRAGWGPGGDEGPQGYSPPGWGPEGWGPAWFGPQWVAWLGPLGTGNEYTDNLTQRINESIRGVNDSRLPTCPTYSTSVATTISTTYDPFANLTGTIMGKCFFCGMTNIMMPREADCSDGFAGDLLPLLPVDPRARGKVASFRKYCRWMNVPKYIEVAGDSRSIWGRWTGGCSVRWIDVSGIYTQRTCRNRHLALRGKHWLSKRMAKLEQALQHTNDECIASPAASLVPLSRGVTLYARFHVCVCSTHWCNRAAPPHPCHLAHACALLLLLFARL